MFWDFHRWTVRLGNSFFELSLSQFYANHDEDYDIWVVKFACLTSFNFFRVKAALIGHVAFDSIILFENSAMPWLVTLLLYVSMQIYTKSHNNFMENFFCNKKQLFHEHLSY